MTNDTCGGLATLPSPSRDRLSAAFGDEQLSIVYYKVLRKLIISLQLYC